MNILGDLKVLVMTMGKNVLNIAELTAKTLEISDQDLETLENMSFEESQEHALNVKFRDLFQLAAKNDSIKYAYILRKLPENKVKYQVENEDAEFYGLDPGTDLDYIWLLDVIVDENQQKKVEEIADYYKDKNRYTKKQDEVAEILEAEKTTYLLSQGEWGTQISGLVPVYTTEGNYIGLLGVDMYSKSFFEYRSVIFWTLILLVVIPALSLSCLYIYLHRSYRKKMADLAYKDQLTGVYNRRYYDIEGQKIFERAYKENVSIGIIMGDIDDFKRYNDKFGHQEGDIALQSVAKVLHLVTNEKKGFTARYGGEEFVIILSDLKEIESVCRAICKAVEEQAVTHTDGSHSHVTISLGAYNKVPDKDDSLELYVKKADQAMYLAKNAGKNTYIVE